MDMEKVIKGLEELSSFLFREYGKVHAEETNLYYDRFLAVEDALAMLKEQEAVKPKTGHWIFESAYCEAWSHTCSECGKRMATAYNTYANYCWNCGANMECR